MQLDIERGARLAICETATVSLRVVPLVIEHPIASFPVSMRDQFHSPLPVLDGPMISHCDMS
jgi:hypothetical protein